MIEAIERGVTDGELPSLGGLLGQYRQDANVHYDDPRAEDARSRGVACVERLLGVMRARPAETRQLCENQLLERVRHLEAIVRDMTRNEPEDLLEMFNVRDAVHEVGRILAPIAPVGADIRDSIDRIDGAFRANAAWLKQMASPFHDARIAGKPAEYWWWRLMTSGGPTVSGPFSKPG